MDDDRPLAAGRPGTELTGMAVPFQNLSAETGEVVLLPMPARLATGAQPGDQLPFPAAGSAP